MNTSSISHNSYQNNISSYTAYTENTPAPSTSPESSTPTTPETQTSNKEDTANMPVKQSEPASSSNARTDTTFLTERIQSLQEERFSYMNERKKKKKASSFFSHKHISAANYMRKLANASSVTKVSGVVRIARNELRFIRSSDAPQDDIKKAERILLKAINKGTLKMRRLNLETQIESQKELAESIKNKREEERLRTDLEQKRHNRRVREKADIADPDHVTITPNKGDSTHLPPWLDAYKSMLRENESHIDIKSKDSAPISVDSASDCGASVDVSL